MNSEKLKQIIYISIPESMQHNLGSLELDPSILLPVEVPEGQKPEEWQPENLSWEMIVSGMLKVLAYDEDNKNREYFREFTMAARPEIAAELTQSAVIKAQSGDFELAEEIFLALIGLDETDLRTRLNLVLLYENKLNNRSGASHEDRESLHNQIEENYQDLLPQGEDLPDIYFNAAWFYYSNQDFKRAYELSENYLSMGEDEVKRSESEKLLRECSELKDTNELYREAYRLVNDDKNEEGLDLISNFLIDNPEVWNGWFLQGWAYRKLSRFEDALGSFKKAAEIKGDHVDILNELAICFLELGQYDESRKALEEALGMDPENLKIISNMGILCLKEEKKEEAAAFFRTVLLLEPEDKVAAEYLDYIEKT
ncbi:MULTISPECIES: tetratricopeptide repeat protein [unclassified Oceanispirochaeta]|uniref:tetratricopeptide repeat protein n=1 Tax=unclassified Oceanispirochaeta TaxID=2635722 RepID=UPI000E091FBD|nr:MULTISPECIES: tetratricopeptide repeat protein [unclassified Oceanispirochaeta]MBF9014833.1 tetratricopeptide repeat protein [Oceanispirochaeta sp. M2]NPD71089.1 tetratricopeptide repeat protein [Oceanispirochaeta sp. M1]RDG33921.1 tetratricopeptide repeat protein [Oceanispirochaeta sp. M1]